MVDYRQCDVCGQKAFYDANLFYRRHVLQGTSTPYRTRGIPQYIHPILLKTRGLSLDNLGDWAVLCTTCAKSYKTVIEPIIHNL